MADETGLNTAVEMPPNQMDVPIEQVRLQSSPYLAADSSIPKVMYNVVLAMLPMTLWSFWAFGMQAVSVMAWSILFMLGFDYFFARFSHTHAEALRQMLDGSALVSGILLGLNLGAASPWWIMLVGSLLAMGIGKHAYGGLGRNPFNPVLVGRVFLLISFPAQMTTWTAAKWARDANPLQNLDAITSATPLGALKEGGWTKFVEAFQKTDLWNYILFNKGGCLGDVSLILLLLGALYLLARKIITWQIPVAYIGVVAALTGAMYLVDPGKYANPLFHLATGSLLLGAFFMATDMVTSPISRTGQLIFGAGCGLLTAAIRLWGSFPEGVSFAILIMNGLTPLIDKWTKPALFGAVPIAQRRQNNE
jgi:Na+-translocating ferredoxin:NAD+ oxidoreductase subunit D